MITLEKITKQYRNDYILRDIQCSLPQQGITSIIGPNGAGKSTLLGIICRLIKAQRGTVSLDGIPLHRIPDLEIARCIGILKQDTSMNMRLTVQELVEFGRYPHSHGKLNAYDREQVLQALHYTELESLAHRRINELSGGQRQRAFVAMILAQDTQYVFLDEPLNNLDMKHSQAMMSLIRKLTSEKQKAVVIVIHDINFASCYSDRIIALRDGKIIADGAPKEIISPDILKEIYGINIDVHQVNGKRIVTYY